MNRRGDRLDEWLAMSIMAPAKSPVVEIGMKFGRLTVVDGPRVRGRSIRCWRCRCECGTHTISQDDQLRRKTRSCGCSERKIKAFGKALSVAQWAADRGITEDTIYGRLRAGWSAEEALSVIAFSAGMRRPKGEPSKAQIAKALVERRREIQRRAEERELMGEEL